MTDQTDSSPAASEIFLSRAFETWRAEFRSILEDHRREIHLRLEQIEREIEKKSDKDHVELLTRTINADLKRHADDIKNLYSGLNDKMGTDTMWKVVGLVLTLGGLVGGIFGFLVHLLAK